MTRRNKTFEERRQELIGAICILDNMLQHFEESGDISFLRVIAGQLRALVVYEPQSFSLRHPLLIDLAREVNFPLLVFSIDPKVADTLVNMLTPYNLQFLSTGDVISLEREPPYLTELLLESAMESQYILIDNERLSMKQIIRIVADTEATHYDPSRPDTLDKLDTIQIMGLPPEYRTIYGLGKIIRDLSYIFIKATT